MPALERPRWERFAQAIAQGLADESYSQGRAYKAAGYNVNNTNAADAAASRLLRKVRPILDRVREIQEQAAKRVAVTVESIVDELEEARALAKEEKQPSAMVSASATKAKVLGLSVERHEHGTPGQFADSQSTGELADAELRERNPALVTVSNAMRVMALEAMQRYDATLDAIAHGDRLDTAQ